MKHTLQLVFAVLLLSIYSCEDQIIEEFTANVPVYMSYEELRSAVIKENTRDLKQPGKLYFFNDYIFINEVSEGVHIINNSDPENPVNEGFISIPGNFDIAIKDNILYADSYIDLVAIDISDISNISEVGRIEGTFNYTIPETGNNYRIDEIDEQKGVVIDWEIKTLKKEIEQPPVYPIYYYADYMLSSSVPVFRYNGADASVYGIGGSMARFALHQNILYVIGNYEMFIYDISDLNNPIENGKFYAGWDIETLFLYQSNLFIGTMNGMIIYDISSPSAPQFVSEYRHITSCDPVVVEGNYAYVTLRSGTTCWNSTTNQLDVVDISDLTQPTWVKSYAMTNPHGLGIDNGTLFICDGNAGLKVYDASDPLNITNNKLATFSNIQATDVIPVNGILLMIGDDGFYQYDYSDINNIQLLSYIEVNNEE